MSKELKSKVQSQFGASADAYATSDVHARGESLSILAELINPRPNWCVLDVGTGAGHTAFLFAPFVTRVVATDLTKEMLEKCAELVAVRGLTNIETKIADAEALPFDDLLFDLVTCRLALHHFPDPRKAISEFARVLKPDGVLGLTDNIHALDKKDAEYYNTYEKLRDPSHNWVFSLANLTKMIEKAGLKVTATRELTKEFEFQNWTDRQNVSEAKKEKLLEMMHNIPEMLKIHFTPRWKESTMYFSLREGVIIAKKSRN